jgi:hypothetical protein
MTRWSTVLAGVIVSGVALATMAGAQTKLTLTVPPVLVAEPGAQTALSLSISPSHAVPASAFVRVRGVPAAIRLSEGHVVTQGVWAVPLFAVQTLKLEVPGGATGRSDLSLALVTANGEVLAETRTAVVVATVAFGARREAAPVQAEAKGDAPPRPAAPVAIDIPALAQGYAAKPPTVAAPATPPRDDRLYASGRIALQAGRFEAARLYFERAARDGDSRAALAMGETFDPEVLDRSGTRGPLPDVEAAILWYERAASLGEPDAPERLARVRRRLTDANCLPGACPARTR